MNTTHTNEPTGQGAKQVAIQLGGEVLLRDYFAAKAMQSYLMLEATQEVLGDELVSPKQYCALFYQWADAMLKAREQ